MLSKVVQHVEPVYGVRDLRSRNPNVLRLAGDRECVLLLDLHLDANLLESSTERLSEPAVGD
jgi:hypothetical protein